MRVFFTALLLVASPALACEDITYLGTSFTICEVRAEEDLRLFHSDENGTLLGGFGAAERSLGEGEKLGFAMNAGMYHSDRSPVGLFVQEGVERSAIASGGGYGNFGLLPNGVFCIGETLRVIETDAYRSEQPICDYATQSGPMLVIEGDLHPRLIPGGTSRYIRNGVGTSADGHRAVFAISNDVVNFHDFATLFRDHLGLPNALYFDGKVSRLHAPDLGRSDIGFALGVMVGTVVPR